MDNFTHAAQVTMVPDTPPRGQSIPSADNIKSVQLWVRMLEGCYGTSPVSGEDGVITWAGLLHGCDAGIMTQAVRNWMAEESRKPKPADLLRGYKSLCEQTSGKRQSDAYIRQIVSPDGEATYRCPYCRDKGMFLAEYLDPKHRGETFACKCNCDRSSGNLGNALADPRWRWNADNWRFGAVWVGEANG